MPFLLRIQGISTLARVRGNLQQGQLPATEMVEGIILLICGALLLTPGFFTDSLGFLCLIPVVRTRFAQFIIRRVLSQRQQHKTAKESDVIDAEYWTSTDDKMEHQRKP